MVENSEKFLDLYPNRSMLMAPSALGNVSWPNKITLPADLNYYITHKIWEYISDHDDDIADCLSCIMYITGAISYNISFFSLAKSRDFKSGGGVLFSVNFSYSDLFAYSSPYSRRDLKVKGMIKGFISRIYNRVNILKASFVSGVPVLTITNDRIVQDMCGAPVLLRNPTSIISRSERPSRSGNTQKIDQCAGILSSFVSEAIESSGVEVDNKFRDLIEDYISIEVSKVFADLSKVKRFFKGRKFHLVERSLSPYLISLFAAVCRRNGGQVHSTYHGVCQTANEPDISTMINSSVFWGVSEAFCDDANALIKRLPPGVDRKKIKNLDLKGLQDRFLRANVLRKKIKHVAIMGRQVVMRYSAFNTLEFPAYLKLERDVAIWLLKNGYKVTYKAHPESDWRHFDTYLPEGVLIDWEPFEEVVDQYDAFFYHFGASSTLPAALGSGAHVFMLKDGWHDVKLWPPRLQAYFEIYCNMVSAQLSQQDFISLDYAELERKLREPAEVSVYDRIYDFYYRREFS
ncbi:hypothetical protein [Thalassospira sp. MIT1370]|uniref:hypothetical protein n=1 Tax=unclassified Thalassospira TaxID=2648997 RepID=UPI00399B2C9C